MKTNATRAKDYKFTADLWTFTTSTDAEGGVVRTFSFARSITLLAQTGMFGKMKVFMQDVDSDIIVGYQLHNFLDAAGTELQANAIWEIDQFQPNLNMWGVREGFVGRVTWVGVDA